MLLSPKVAFIATTQYCTLPPVIVTGRDVVSFLSDFAHAALWETLFSPIVAEFQNILLSPYYRDNIEADHFPSTGH